LLVLLFTTFLYADQNKTLTNEQINYTKEQIAAITKSIGEDNIYRKIYSNFQTYNDLQQKLDTLQNDLKKVKKGSIEHSKLLEQEELLLRQLTLLQDYAKSPFEKIMQPKVIESELQVTNPFSIITAVSYLKQLNIEKEDYLKKFEALRTLIDKLNKKHDLALMLANVDSSYEDKAVAIEKEIAVYSQLLRTYSITRDVYLKEVTERTLVIQEEIQKEIKRLLILLAILAGLFIFVALIKYAIKKYISDNERFYLANKTINLTFVTIAVIIIAFRYIENVTYIVTFLGFASAGIAIAMKDWFMSVIGWMVIVFGGSIHVGDRIKVRKDGLVYVGDVIDISLFRMTVHEDVTLTTYLENRRSGRIVFVPNHYIFTSLIANYSHSGMKTVWDGIDFTVTFDSNVQKATQIAKEIAKKYAKGYTNITRTQLNKLRSKYSLKNTNVEPRVFSFIETNGVRVSVWYMTNAFATLQLRSNISAEIVETIQKEDDIILAYPTQSIYMDKDVRKPFDLHDALEDKGGVLV
jgi:small-conductance mechanosensitive channel